MALLKSEDMCIREFIRRDGVVLNIGQLLVGDVGCVVWDAAIVLSHFLDTAEFLDASGTSILANKHVVELGSGTGLVGIQAAVNGANCIVTDLDEFIPLLELNIGYNRFAIKGSVKARPLKWGKCVKKQFLSPDFVLVADCLYYEESIFPLFVTICDLCGHHTLVYFCYEIRDSQEKKLIASKFFELVKSKFNIEQISTEKQDPEFSSHDIVIFKFSRH